MEKIFSFSDIDQKELEKIIHESVQKVINEQKRGLITEMALNRSVYKEKIDNLSSQLLINWCLVHYCTLTNRERTKSHWKSELKACFYNMSKLSIKENNSPKNRLKVLEEVWDGYDYQIPYSLNLTVLSKFEDENIDTKSLEYQYVINDCIRYTKDIFNVILSKNNEIIWKYVNSI